MSLSSNKKDLFLILKVIVIVLCIGAFFSEPFLSYIIDFLGKPFLKELFLEIGRFLLFTFIMYTGRSTYHAKLYSKIILLFFLPILPCTFLGIFGEHFIVVNYLVGFFATFIGIFLLAKEEYSKGRWN